MIRNYYLLTGIVIVFLAMVPFVYILSKQYQEYRRPKSNLTPTRRYLLLTEFLLVLLFIPGLPRAFQTLSLPAVNNWAKLASITNRLPYLLIALFLLAIYREKID